MNLCDTYRPARLADVAGNPKPLAILSALVARPFPSAWLLEGPSGIGKTSAALAVAGALASGPDTLQMVGPDVTADSLRAAWDTLRLCAWRAGGWRILIIDEADAMTRTAQTLALGYLEAIPPRAIVLLTSNEGTDSWEPRLLSRLKRLHFTAQGMANAGAARLTAIARAEGYALPERDAVRLMRDAGNNVRSATQALELEIMSGSLAHVSGQFANATEAA